MDSDHFDAFVRALSSAGSRRAALSGLLGGVLGLSAVAEAVADRRDKTRRRRLRRRRKRERRHQRRQNTPGPAPLICDQVTLCNTAPTLCNQSGTAQCICLKVFDSELSLCAAEERQVTGCEECETGEICVFYDNECDPPVVGCARPCPNAA